MPNKYSAILVCLLSLLLTSNASAHGDKDKPLFVAPDGVDFGRCQDAAAPCKTIGYALRWVGKGGQIRVAIGAYEMTSAEDLFHLVGGAIDVRGGFKKDDGFLSPSDAASTLTGVPLEYRAALSESGFHVVADGKSLRPQIAEQIQQLLSLHESLKSSMPAAPCIAGSANGLACSNIDLLSHVALGDVSTSPGSAADVWGFVDLNTNREYAIAGFRSGTAVFDVTDAENPREVGFIDGQIAAWRDIKVYQLWNDSDARWNAFAYVTTDNSSDGLFVLDLTDLPHSVQRSSYPSDFSAAHNVYATNTDFGTGLSLTGDDPTLIIAGSNNGSGRYRAYSLADPEVPSFLAMPGSGGNDYMHDAASMRITDSRKDTDCQNASDYCEVLFDFNEGTVEIWDVTVPTDPRRLSSTAYNQAEYVHSGWSSEDKQYLFVHDELDEMLRADVQRTTVRVFSLSNLTAPVEVGAWTGPTEEIDHNGFVRGNRYYMSHYSRGLTILDISDARNPIEAGNLDTYPGQSVNTIGAWGVYPFFHSGNIAINDINSGFYMAADRTLDVAAGTLSFSRTSFGGEEGMQLQLAVNRSGGSTGEVGVDYEIVPATGSSADVASVSGVMTWSAGDTTDKVVNLDLLNDGLAEGIERMLVRLVAPTGGATLAAANVASIYVSEPGAVSIVEFDRGAIDIAERGFATAVAVLQRTGSAVGAISVDYSMSGGDADPGVDFQGATSGTINWADGDADPKWIEFAISDDGNGEALEFVELSMSNAVGASVGGQATLRINIVDGTGINSRPVSNAGRSQTVTGGTTVTLDGSQSNDPEGDTLTYQWTQITGNTVALTNANAAMATFVAPTVTSDMVLRFELAVSDTTGLNNTSTTAVTITKPRKSGGSGGGSMSWLLLVLLAAISFKRMLFDNRLLAIRSC